MQDSQKRVTVGSCGCRAIIANMLKAFELLTYKVKLIIERSEQMNHYYWSGAYPWGNISQSQSHCIQSIFTTELSVVPRHECKCHIIL